MIELTVRNLTSLREKSLGLLGAFTPVAIMLHTRWGIHTFGMKFPIDILVLSSTKKVVRLKTSLLPNRIFIWSILYNIVLELPAGTIKKREIKLGDSIKTSYQK